MAPLLLTLLQYFVLFITCHSDTTINTYGTFESVGVTIDTTDDHQQIVTPTLWYKLSDETEYIIGHSFTRINVNRWVSSIFEANPNSTYNIKVTFTGSGTILDGVQFDNIIQSTRDYTEIELQTQLQKITNSYVISPSGTGTECDITTPCQWSTAFGLLQSNEEILLTNGTYFIGDVNLIKTDTILRGMDGSDVILDGALPQNYFNWTMTNGLDNVYQTNITNLREPYGIIANSQRLFPYGCLNNGCTLELNSLSLAEINGFYYIGDILYVKFSDANVDPNKVLFEISQYRWGFVAVANTYFYNLKFQNYGQGQYAKAIYINGDSGVVVKNCTFYHNNAGVAIKRQYDNMVVDNNEFIDTRFHFKWEAVKASDWLEIGGLTIFASDEDGQGCVIMNNIFHGFFDCMTPGASKPNNLGTNELDIYNNIMYECGDDAMSNDGYCSNCRVWKNVIYNSLTAISVAPLYDGPIYLLRNIIYYLGTGNSNAGYSGLSFKTNSGYDPSGYIYIYHNTIHNTQLNDEYGIWLKDNGDWEKIVVRNNIFLASSYAILNSNVDSVDFDSDCLYSTQNPSGELVRWMSIKYNLSQFQEVHNQEINGIYYHPMFMNINANDYRLDPIDDAILIDTAQIINGLNVDYLGNGPDFGALEFVSHITTDSPWPGTTNVIKTSNITTSTEISTTSTLSKEADSCSRISFISFVFLVTLFTCLY